MQAVVPSGLRTPSNPRFARTPQVGTLAEIDPGRWLSFVPTVDIIMRAKNRRARMFRGIVCLSFFLSICGCSDTAGFQRTDSVVRDSAGIQIIEAGSIDDMPADFQLSEKPDWVMGWSQGDYLFQNISAGHFLSDGRAVVADGRSREVVLLSVDGQVDQILGGPGEGPGEFTGIPGMVVQGHDTIVVQDAVAGRLTFFHEGRMTHTYPLADLPFDHHRTIVGIDNRNRLIFYPISTPFGGTFDEPWLRAPLIGLDLSTGVFDTAFVFDYLGNTNAREGYLVGRMGTLAITRSGYIYGQGHRSRLEFMDFDGQVIRVLNWEEAPLVATEDYWSDYATETVNLDPNRAGDIAQSIEARKELGDLLPYFPTTNGGFPAFLTDESDRLWVPLYSASSVSRLHRRYRIFSPQGAWLGWVTLPERSRVLDIQDDRALVYRLDQFRVPAIALYRLEEVPSN